jgi:outer membrane autotransporter protein
MLKTTKTSYNIKVVNSQRHYRIGCTIAALCVGSFASPAFAADECGVPSAGTVTCAPNADNFPGGITYVAPADVIVNAPATVTVATTTAATNGIAITGAQAATLAGAAIVSTTGTGSNGVVLTSGTGPASVDVGNVNTAGALAAGVVATGGPGQSVTVRTGDVATTGNTANGVNVLGAGPVSVTTGTVTTLGTGSNGILAVSSAGPVTVNAGTTTVSGAGGNAIQARGTGPVLVTSGSASANTEDAIIAVSSAGPATVTLTPGQITATTGNGVAITSATTATLNTASGTTVNGGLNGAVLTGATGSTVNNAGTLQGRVYAVSASGGPATVNNAGTIRGAVALNGAGSTFNNTGSFDAAGVSSFGAGSVLNNSGLFQVRSVGVIPGTATLTGLGTLRNTGLIDLRSGAIGNTLTTTGNYVGSGNAQLGVRIAPGTAIPADQLIVGGSATGSTQVAFDLAPGSQPLFNTGSTIVQAGTGSTAGAFSVDPASQSVGLVRYDVVFNPATSDYALVAGPSDAAYHTLGYQNALRNMWYKSADAVTTEFRTKRDTLWNMGGTAPSGRFWLSMGASVDNTKGYRGFGTLGQTNLTDTTAHQDFFGGQIGLDLTGGVSDRGGFSVGITGGFIHSITDLGHSTDNFRINGANGGVYASFTQGNVFATVLGKYDHYWARAESQTAGFGQNLSGHSYGVRGELGTRFGSNSFFMEPVAQLSWIRSTLDPFAVLGTRVDFNERDGLRGKLGARIGGNTGIGNGAKMAFYAGGNYVHEFKGQDSVTFSNLGGSFTVDGQKHRDYGEAIAGFNIAASGSATTYFMEGTYEHSFGGSGNGQLTQEGFGGRAGIRFKL